MTGGSKLVSGYSWLSICGWDSSLVVVGCTSQVPARDMSQVFVAGSSVIVVRDSSLAVECGSFFLHVVFGWASLLFQCVDSSLVVVGDTSGVASGALVLLSS